MDISTTKTGRPTDINSLTVSGSDLHVSIHAGFRVGDRSKRFILTVSKDEAMNICAAMLQVLSDADAEAATRRAGGVGNTMKRYPEFRVFTANARKYLKGRGSMVNTTPNIEQKATHCQLVTTTSDANGNSRQCIVLYTLDGHVIKIVSGGYSYPKVQQSLIMLPAMKVSASDYKGWIKRGEVLNV